MADGDITSRDEAASLAGVSRPAASPQEFVADWNRMVATVAEFSAKWNLPKGEMIFHPRVHAAMDAVSGTRILGTLIYMGVKVRFGHFEQMSVLKEG